jgi:hypothetical protein
MHSFRTDSRLFRDALERLGGASPTSAGEEGQESGKGGGGMDFVSERREIEPRVLGRLVALNGTRGILSCPLDTSEENWSVGHLITIVHKTARLVGPVCDVETHDGRWSATEVNSALASHLSVSVCLSPYDQPLDEKGIFRILCQSVS